ncbi:uncharacterized protein NPIL_559561 [Nephila pilipes]|uniref:Uncharacterized protein n=1 Tax=Nephila pilipes TaxID=299642 RepID=A0A8X6Q8F0_NEPPI|nr:uncharacterized protein NPIL_559561 [Nephila pilipes]
MTRSLYEICRTKVFGLLKNEFWNSCPENPFSSFPSTIIHDLVSYIINFQSSHVFRAADLQLLLASGRVLRFEINNIKVNDELIPILQFLLPCKDLQTLRLTDVGEFSTRTTEQLEKLLSVCTDLEDLHCSVVFDLKALRKCSKLRYIRLHFTPKQPFYEFLQTTGTCRKPQKYLKVFTICKDLAFFIPHGYITELLVHCPNLHSLGYIDVSAALEYLHGSAVELGSVPQPYQLRSCFWGGDVCSRNRYCGKFQDSLQRCWPFFPFAVKVAVLSCPLLEELVIEVTQQCYVDAIIYLNVLTNLTYLEIDVEDYICNFRPELYCLLDRIGPQLKHLAILKFDNVEFDAIFKNCPNLESLKVDCESVVSDWVETIGDLPNLRRLSFFCRDGDDRKSIQLALSKCFFLEELFLKNAAFLNDSCVANISEQNPLEKLELVCISHCAVTKRGLKMFVNGATKLEKICFDSYKLSDEDTIEVLRAKNPKMIIYPEYDILLDHEFFYRNRYFCQ